MCLYLPGEVRRRKVDVRQVGKREFFLLWLLAGLLAWQAGIFTYGVHLCAQAGPMHVIEVCPDLGSRYDKFVQTSLGAVLGLLAGQAMGSSRRRDD